MKKKVKVELRKLNTMTEAEANEIQDVWQLDLNSRWQLYRYSACPHPHPHPHPQPAHVISPGCPFSVSRI